MLIIEILLLLLGIAAIVLSYLYSDAIDNLENNNLYIMYKLINIYF